MTTIPASFLFGGLLQGGIDLQREVQVPGALIVALNGLVVIFVVSSLKARGRLGAWADRFVTSGSGPAEEATDAADDARIEVAATSGGDA